MWLLKFVSLFYGDEYDGKIVQNSIILPLFIKYQLCAWQGVKGLAYFIPKVLPVWLETETHAIKKLASSNYQNWDI